jgi:hypothetical protein
LDPEDVLLAVVLASELVAGVNQDAAGGLKVELLHFAFQSDDGVGRGTTHEVGRFPGIVGKSLQKQKEELLATRDFHRAPFAPLSGPERNRVSASGAHSSHDDREHYRSCGDTEDGSQGVTPGDEASSHATSSSINGFVFRTI